jgi:hypothetical protein
VKAGKKFLSLALVVLMCLSMLPVGALAEDEESQEIEISEEPAEETEMPTPTPVPTAPVPEPTVPPGATPVPTAATTPASTQGTCGYGLTWTLTDDGVLTISGKGTMNHYTSWNSEKITQVVISEGVTRIDCLAFAGCNNLTSVTILNKDCEITVLTVDGEDFTDIPVTAVIHGYDGSTAQAYAEKYGNTFEAIEHDHVFASGTVTTSPTCTTEGVKTYTCKVCGTTKMETIKALGHSYTATVVKPTCTAKGYTLHECNRCGSSYKDTETAMIAHTWDAGKVTKEPTYTTAGEKTFTCTVCKTTKTESIDELAYLKGDVDGDGAITLMDVTLLFQYVNKQITQDKVKVFAAADVDGNGEVELQDVTKLFQYVNKQINSL